MRTLPFFFALLALALHTQAQTNPAITHWLLNTTNLKGRHYVRGNSTPIEDNVPANVQSVQYSSNWVYVDATGIPAYITGPFLDGNTSLATEQTGYFRIPLSPKKTAAPLRPPPEATSAFSSTGWPYSIIGTAWPGTPLPMRCAVALAIRPAPAVWGARKPGIAMPCLPNAGASTAPRPTRPWATTTIIKIPLLSVWIK